MSQCVALEHVAAHAAGLRGCCVSLLVETYDKDVGIPECIDPMFVNAFDHCISLGMKINSLRLPKLLGKMSL